MQAAAGACAGRGLTGRGRARGLRYGAGEEAACPRYFALSSEAGCFKNEVERGVYSRIFHPALLPCGSQEGTPRTQRSEGAVSGEPSIIAFTARETKLHLLGRKKKKRKINPQSRPNSKIKAAQNPNRPGNEQALRRSELGRETERCSVAARSACSRPLAVRFCYAVSGEIHALPLSAERRQPRTSVLAGSAR